MERRKGNVIIHASGGTAGKGANTYKLTLPSSWMKEMGIHENQREVELCFDGHSITVSCPMSMEEFISNKRTQGHELSKLSYYNGDSLCTTIIADRTDHSLHVENHSEQLLKTAFGNNDSPTWEDLEYFLAERCVPRTRAGLREYLETIGVEEYDPFVIIQKTAGRMAEDDQWIKVEVLS